MQIPYRKPGKYGLAKLDPLMTEAKFRDLESKLFKLKSISKPKAMAEVARLADTGDYSENAGYQAAKGRLRGINQRILELEIQLKNAIIIKKKTNSSIQIGNTVTFLANGKQIVYQILGSAEANPAEGIISHNSPIGQILIGKKVGEVFSTNFKDKKIIYTILKIE